MLILLKLKTFNRMIRSLLLQNPVMHFVGLQDGARVISSCFEASMQIKISSSK